MEWLELDNGIQHLAVRTDGTMLRLQSAGRTVELNKLCSILYGGELRLDPVMCGKTTVIRKNSEIVIQIKDIVWYARFPGHGYLKPEPPPPFVLTLRVALDEDETRFLIDVPEGLDDEPLEIAFPHKGLCWKATDHCTLAGSFRTHGTLFRFPSGEAWHQDMYEFLPVAGVYDERGLTALSSKTPFDHTLTVTSDGENAGCFFKNEFIRGKSEYVRELRMKLYPAGSGYMELAKWYRKSVQKEGRFVSLRRKMEQVPEIAKLPGTVFWKHNVYYQDQLPKGITRDWSLYIFRREEAEPEGKPGNWTAREIFDTAKQAGFDRVCIFNTGWNFAGYDSAYPTRLPPNPARGTAEEFRKAAEYGRSLSPGYICSVHDNYRDFYASSREFDRNDLVWTADGAPLKGPIWHGGRSWIACCRASAKYAERDLARIAELTGRGAIYLDVMGFSRLNNCFNPAHPGSRKDDAQWRLEIIRLAHKYIGAVATEGTPFDWMAGAVEIGAFAQINAYQKWNACPIPFFELVYHDSVLNYASCGHCGYSGKKYPAHVALYGLLPYNFDADSLRISKELRSSCFEEMLSHEFLDGSVEKTVFADGTTVTANFGAEEFDGIPPDEYRIEK